ncbi:DUF3995 domain-containing protein [Streptomyces sp. KLOTTS4A1]|uniref:DUF3995 domain-containing protein n=1 Tax=Streptomyces sp. KLOTTS4A1 TaxID=3390996 RepID=UPI0039F53076
MRVLLLGVSELFFHTEGDLVVDLDARRRAARAVACLLALDGLAHLYWATGVTWPANDERALSRAVVGAEVSFAPPVVLPLALMLFTAAAAVLARGYGRGGRLAGLVSYGVAAGLSVRALAGVAWAVGFLDDAGPAFHWLNLLLYTPVCLVFGWLVATRVAPTTAAIGRGRAQSPTWVEEFPREH